ncbi:MULTISPECIES: hypothetical protein [unclassified Halomonas]|uniref:hypothetical protein n=1 Tax=unclassified Halomonas TaxID=2609666 RepID=UPI0013B3A71E|nr:MULTISPECIES: hypothetical protein [unclassified Halomonas]
MRTAGWMIILVMAVLMVGCSYDPARVSPEPLIIIDDDHRDHRDHDGGDFCPPGQAKKGRC